MASAKSREQKIWEANLANCCLLLEQSYLSVATKSFQAGLIDFDLLDAVTNKRLAVTKQEQAQTLVNVLYKTIDAKPAEASDTMKSFLKILERDTPFGSLVKEIEELLEEETGENREKSVFQKKMFAITALLENSLLRVSTACLSSGLIGEGTHALTTDAGATHTSNYINKLLGEIGKKIQQKSSNLEVFKDQVLAPMGEFAAVLIKQLGIPDSDDKQEEEPKKEISKQEEEPMKIMQEQEEDSTEEVDVN